MTSEATNPKVPQWYAEMTDPDYHKTCVQARAELLAMMRPKS